MALLGTRLCWVRTAGEHGLGSAVQLQLQLQNRVHERDRGKFEPEIPRAEFKSAVQAGPVFFAA